MKYDKATEEIVLLKTELAAIETLRIENQRLKDELRDLKEEYTLLKERQPPPAIIAAEDGAVGGSPVRHHTPPSPPISDGSRALTPSSEAVTSPPKASSGVGVGGINGNGTWRGVKLGRGPRMSIASDVSWASEARQTSSVKIMHDMVSRVKVNNAPLLSHGRLTTLAIESGSSTSSLSRFSQPSSGCIPIKRRILPNKRIPSLPSKVARKRCPVRTTATNAALPSPIATLKPPTRSIPRCATTNPIFISPPNLWPSTLRTTSPAGP